ncbi:hypothetical protein N7530_008442 [Penicillium desertorum]|uniref:Uncharacterized protein n=1 Tax=Penicillium desertorum TaxID=1303715 RepID=A0A9W9WP44_9EURO|nr:hypothetical protein N7530_008442 [Penicillium desertorum]
MSRSTTSPNSYNRKGQFLHEKLNIIFLTYPVAAIISQKLTQFFIASTIASPISETPDIIFP